MLRAELISQTLAMSPDEQGSMDWDYLSVSLGVGSVNEEDSLWGLPGTATGSSSNANTLPLSLDRSATLQDSGPAHQNTSSPRDSGVSEHHHPSRGTSSSRQSRPQGDSSSKKITKKTKKKTSAKRSSQDEDDGDDGDEHEGGNEEKVPKIDGFRYMLLKRTEPKDDCVEELKIEKIFMEGQTDGWYLLTKLKHITGSIDAHSRLAKLVFTKQNKYSHLQTQLSESLKNLDTQGSRAHILKHKSPHKGTLVQVNLSELKITEHPSTGEVGIALEPLEKRPRVEPKRDDVELLRTKYQEFSLSMMGDGDHPLSRKSLASTFVRLMVVKLEEKAKGGHGADRKRNPIALSALFADAETKRVVAQGAAGMGKSTLMKHICQRWALGESAPVGPDLWNPDFDAVILIELALHRPALLHSKSWIDFLQCVLPDEIDAKALWQWAKPNDRVLWILDGIDEVSSLAQSTILGQILQEKDLFGSSRVLFGTRPEAKRGIQSHMCVEIVGFTDADVVRYVMQYFGISQPLPNPELGLTLHYLSQVDREYISNKGVVMPESASRPGLEILKLLESSNDMISMMKTPMNAEFVCFAAAQHLLNQKTPPQVTTLYSKVLHNMIESGLSKASSALLTSERVLHLLSRASWESFDGDQGFVSHGSLQHLIESLHVRVENENAIAKLLERCGPWRPTEDGYHWLHSTFQEYLAAHYVCAYMDESELQNALAASECFFSERSIEFYSFVCGIAGGTKAPNSKKALKIIGAMMESAWKTWAVDKTNVAAERIVRLISTDGSDFLLDILKRKAKDEDALEDMMDAACEEGILKPVETLVQKGADADFGMESAAQGGHLAIVKVLLTKGADPNEGLWGAAHKGHLAVVEELLKAGADPSEGIHFAVPGSASMAVVELLLDQGADPSRGIAGLAKNLPKQPNSQDVARIMAIVELLLDRGAGPTRGLTDLAETAANGDKLVLAVAEVLLDRGANLNAVSSHTNFVNFLKENTEYAPNIGKAVRDGNFPAVKALLEQGVDPNRGMWGAALSGHKAIVKLLLEQKADPNRGMSGAAKGGHMEIVELLLDRGADINRSIVDVAVHGCKPIVELLLERNAEPNRGMSGAARGGHMDLVQLLLDRGAHANKGIMDAALCGDVAIVQLLLRNGANPNTPFEEVVLKGDCAVVQVLLDHGADPVLKHPWEFKNPRPETCTALALCEKKPKENGAK